MVGKGDTARPCDKKKFDENYERIFKRKGEQKKDDNKENKTTLQKSPS